MTNPAPAKRTVYLVRQQTVLNTVCCLCRRPLADLRHQEFGHCAACLAMLGERVIAFDASYAHPMVARTVHLLGGLDAILSDNLVADRARFLQAYAELLERETSVVGMVPDVRLFVEEQTTRLLDDRRAAFETGEAENINTQFRKLARGMSVAAETEA